MRNLQQCDREAVRQVQRGFDKNASFFLTKNISNRVCDGFVLAHLAFSSHPSQIFNVLFFFQVTPRTMEIAMNASEQEKAATRALPMPIRLALAV